MTDLGSCGERGSNDEDISRFTSHVQFLSDAQSVRSGSCSQWQGSGAGLAGVAELADEVSARDDGFARREVADSCHADTGGRAGEDQVAGIERTDR